MKEGNEQQKSPREKMQEPIKQDIEWLLNKLGLDTNNPTMKKVIDMLALRQIEDRENDRSN